MKTYYFSWKYIFHNIVAIDGKDLFSDAIHENQL